MGKIWSKRALTEQVSKTVLKKSRHVFDTRFVFVAELVDVPIEDSDLPC